MVMENTIPASAASPEGVIEMVNPFKLDEPYERKPYAPPVETDEEFLRRMDKEHGRVRLSPRAILGLGGRYW
jgi:hypothetical protein